MNDSIENIGVTLPTKWVEFLQQKKSTPIELALLCAGFKQEHKVQKWLLSILQENIDLGDYQKDFKYAIHIFKSLSHSHFYFPLDDKLALNKSEFWYKNTDMLRHLVSMGFNDGIPSFFVNLYTNELIKKQSKIDNSLDKNLELPNHQTLPVHERYKDPRDINSQARKEQRKEFIESITKTEVTSMIQAGKSPFNTDHTLNNSNIDSWMDKKTLALMIKKSKQGHWDSWPNARQGYWTKREVLTHNEFIYLLKGKVHRPIKEKPTQLDYFPLEFCVFYDETVRIIEDSRVLGKITPVYINSDKSPPEIGFKAIDLIELALSKDIDVPEWLPQRDQDTKKTIEATKDEVCNTVASKINYQSWALHDNFDAFTAASLWCDKNPLYCDSWTDIEYIEVRNLIIHIIKHQLDAENYPIEKRNAVVIELGKKLDVGRLECMKESFKFIVSREQLIKIAIKVEVKPRFLFGATVTQGNALTKPEEIRQKELKEKETKVFAGAGNTFKPENDTAKTNKTIPQKPSNISLEQKHTVQPIVNNSKDNEVEEFIKSVITNYPEATTKDIARHCFDSYKSTDRLVRKAKDIAESLGAERDSTTAKRTPEKVKYMSNAPKYK